VRLSFARRIYIAYWMLVIQVKTAREEFVMTETYTQIMICDHGKAGTYSFHAVAESAHNDYWHSSYFPPNARLATETESEQGS
jgi:hypothetical protein